MPQLASGHARPQAQAAPGAGLSGLGAGRPFPRLDRDKSQLAQADTRELENVRVGVIIKCLQM